MSPVVIIYVCGHRVWENPREEEMLRGTGRSHREQLAQQAAYWQDWVDGRCERCDGELLYHPADYQKALNAAEDGDRVVVLCGICVVEELL